MSVAPAPTESNRTGISSSSSSSSDDKLHILESRLNSLQRNLADVSIRSDISPQQREQSKSESLLARIKAAQIDRSRQSQASVGASDGTNSNNSDTIFESVEEKVDVTSTDDVHAVPKVLVYDVPILKVLQPQSDSDEVIQVYDSPNADNVDSEEGNEEIVSDTIESSPMNVIPPPTYNDLEVIESQHSTKYSNALSAAPSQLSSIGIEEQNMEKEKHVVPLDPPTVYTILQNLEVKIPADDDIDQEIIEEQRRIIEQIETEKHSKELTLKMLLGERKKEAIPASHGTNLTSQETINGGQTFLSWEATYDGKPNTATTSEHLTNNMPNTVDLGLGKKVKLYSQERTLESIADGTAKLVQCLNCSAKMKVTRDASLIYCPCCSSVSPVLECSLDNKQEEEDYKLALKLQQEEDSAEAEGEKGWIDWIGEKVGYSSPSKTNENRNEPSTETHQALTGYENSNNEESRVASPSAGYFSCVVDSVSNIASNSYNLASSYSSDDLAFAGVPNTSNSEDTTVDYAPLLEEENL